VTSAFVATKAACLAVFIVALSKSVHNCCVPHQAPASVPGTQSQAIRLLPSLVRPTGSKVEGRPMQVNDLLRMELMAECLRKRPVFLVQQRPWSPSSSTILPQRHYVLYKILAPVRRAIAIRSSSGLSKFPTLHWQLGTLLLYSMSVQNENEPVFECILTCYSKLQALRFKCTIFE